MAQCFPPIDWQAEIDRVRVERLYELPPGSMRNETFSEIFSRQIPVWPPPFPTETEQKYERMLRCERSIRIEQEQRIDELGEQLKKAKAENEKLIEAIENVTARFQRILK